MGISNIFKYRKTFDARGSKTRCEHPIKKYEWNFGDNSELVTTTEPTVNHYYSKRGLYYATLIIEAACPVSPPNTSKATEPVCVGLSDLAIFKLVNKRTEPKKIEIQFDTLKEIIRKIRENTKILYKQAKDTPFESLGKEINRLSQEISQIRDKIGFEKAINNLQTACSDICSKMPEKEKIESCELLEKTKNEQYVDDKLNLINMFLSKIPSQIGRGKDMSKIFNINASGHQSRVNIESEDKSVNIIEDLSTNFENLRILIEKHYNKEDRNDLIQTVNQMKQSCNDLSERNWLKEKLGWILTRTSEFSSISSFVITLLQNLK